MRGSIRRLGEPAAGAVAHLGARCGRGEQRREGCGAGHSSGQLHVADGSAAALFAFGVSARGLSEAPALIGFRRNARFLRAFVAVLCNYSYNSWHLPRTKRVGRCRARRPPRRLSPKTEFASWRRQPRLVDPPGPARGCRNSPPPLPLGLRSSYYRQVPASGLPGFGTTS